MWDPSQATLDKDINGLVLRASAGFRFLASTQGDRVRPLWWKGYRPRARPLREPEATKRQSITGKSDKICTTVTAIEANYVEMSENYSFPDTVQTLLWAQCDPNQCGADQRLPLSQAIRSGDDRAIEQLLRAKANPILTEQGQEAPLSLAVQTGTPSYVRLRLHYSAVPEMPDEVNGNEVFSQAQSTEMARVMQLASSSPAILMLLEAAMRKHWSLDHVRAMLP